MQGHLHIDSEAGFGSRFTAELPLLAHTEAIPPAPLHGRVVVLSNAASGLTELLHKLLPGWGLSYHGFDDAAQAADAAPDLVITDDVAHWTPCAPACRRRFCW